MRILLVNDDGIQGMGLLALAKALYTDGHDLTIVAPQSNRSFASQAMTYTDPVRVQHVTLEALPGVQAFAISGMPADCVMLGVHRLMNQPPDLVLSGINRGENLGMDIMSSGTFNSAALARVLGYPAAAISVTSYTEGMPDEFAFAAEFCRQLPQALIDWQLPEDVVVNINLPRDAGKVRGLRISGLGPNPFSNTYRPLENEPGCYEMDWQETHPQHWDHAGDFHDVIRGYITVTAVRFYTADEQIGRQIEQYGLQWEHIREGNSHS